MQLSTVPVAMTQMLRLSLHSSHLSTIIFGFRLLRRISRRSLNTTCQSSLYSRGSFLHPHIKMPARGGASRAGGRDRRRGRGRHARKGEEDGGVVRREHKQVRAAVLKLVWMKSIYLKLLILASGVSALPPSASSTLSAAMTVSFADALLCPASVQLTSYTPSVAALIVA